MEDEMDSVELINEDNIKDKIYEIRGEKVMLDFELAKLYGYETRYFNQQIKRNANKFPDDFYFKLTKEEFENLMSQNVTSNWGGIRKMPYAFTEQGVYMLMTVLKGELATRQSIALIRTFKRMKDYILNNGAITNGEKTLFEISRQVGRVEEKTLANSKAIKKLVGNQKEIKAVIKEFSKGKNLDEYLILNNEKVEADFIYETIYNSARKTIFIIDNYIGLKTLVHLKEIKNNVFCTIFSNNINGGLHPEEENDFRMQYKNVHYRILMQKDRIHDRFIVVDYGTKFEKVFHCGASSKDAGNKKTMITRVRDIESLRGLLNRLASRAENE